MHLQFLAVWTVLLFLVQRPLPAYRLQCQVVGAVCALGDGKCGGNDKDSQMFALNTQGMIQEVCINLSEEMATWGYVDEIITLKLSMKGVMGISYFWFE